MGACAAWAAEYDPRMKRTAVFVAVLFAASLLPAQSQPAAKPVDGKTSPAKPGVTVKTPAKKEEKKAEEPQIPGVTIARPNGTFLGLELVGGKFKLSFYDSKKKPMAVDVTRATARWPNTRSGTPSDYRTVLNVSGTALVGERTVLPPHVFNAVYITLLQGEGDGAKAGETYVVPFRG